MDYWLDDNPDSVVADQDKHLIFVMVDHFEPGKGERGATHAGQWCDKFRKISDENRDDYGNRFRYSWFYPYDHHNEQVMQLLSKMAYDGYGEIELHWHIDASLGISNENFGDELQKAVEWFQSFGAMITAEENPRTAFAYVAGNWDLDASRDPPICHGITNQIGELYSHGCYADFTYSTIGTESQPPIVNSLYYVEDNPDEAKSHYEGIEVISGAPVSGKLLLFEGPINLHWNGGLEYSSIENFSRFHPERIDDWMTANIHVQGRPEWVFVKVYTHGAQSAETLLGEDLDLMLKSLKNYCREKGIKLHFMTAREAYNVVKAAEADKSGNPEDYRDFAIPKYRNMVELIPAPVSADQ